MNALEELLRRLAANDEDSLRAILCSEPPSTAALSRKSRALVRLSALIAADAPTSSLRWAADMASAAGADDGALVQVLLSSASETGAAQVVSAAPRLAAALDVDIELEGWDGT